MAAGASETYVVFKNLEYPGSIDIYQAGPYTSSHATAATFALRRELLVDHRYDDNASVAEEVSFLKKFTVPLVQLNPMQTILVFSHQHNSIDKKMLINTKFFKKSDKKVEDFIQRPDEDSVRDFFLNVDEKIESYLPGRTENKPDVTKELEKRRNTSASYMNRPTVVRGAADDEIKMIIKRGDGQETLLSLSDAAELFQNQHRLIVQLLQRLKKFEDLEKNV